MGYMGNRIALTALLAAAGMAVVVWMARPRDAGDGPAAVDGLDASAPEQPERADEPEPRLNDEEAALRAAQERDRRDPDLLRRLKAVRAWTRRPPEEAVPGLMAALDDPSLMIRWRAARALGQLGPDAKAATPKLIGLVDNDFRAARQWATTALGEVDADPTVAVPALLRALKDADGRVRRSAATALGSFRPPQGTAVSALLNALDESSWEIRWWAANSLGKLAPAAHQQVVPALTTLLTDPDSRVQSWATWSLAQYGGRARSATAALERASAGGVDGAAWALSQISGVNPPGKKLFPPLPPRIEVPELPELPEPPPGR